MLSVDNDLLILIRTYKKLEKYPLHNKGGGWVKITDLENNLEGSGYEGIEQGEKSLFRYMKYLDYFETYSSFLKWGGDIKFVRLKRDEKKDYRLRSLEFMEEYSIENEYFIGKFNKIENEFFVTDIRDGFGEKLSEKDVRLKSLLIRHQYDKYKIKDGSYYLFRWWVDSLDPLKISVNYKYELTHISDDLLRTGFDDKKNASSVKFKGEKKAYVLLDTNTLIDYPEIISKIPDSCMALVTDIVVMELDKKKTCRDLKDRVRKANYYILNYSGYYKYAVAKRPFTPFEDLDCSPDMKILSIAYRYIAEGKEVTLVTSDYSMQVMAMLNNISYVGTKDFVEDPNILTVPKKTKKDYKTIKMIAIGFACALGGAAIGWFARTHFGRN